MAGESCANISRSRNNNNTEIEPPDRSPIFLKDETYFIGKGNRRSSTPKHRRSRSVSANRITPSALSLSDDHFYEDLAEYVKDMSAQRESVGVGESGEGDVWRQLQQKEADLLLAAELGKALLDKNEELKKEQERIAEEYSKKLEGDYWPADESESVPVVPSRCVGGTEGFSGYASAMEENPT
ncbi:Bicaudal D-related protein-like [Papilio xuthus]|uniref:Bicaudal D-related protein-like n=1 Tax=Papilio xuthus TaxID=66420 RepID=A0A194PT64_PAPXU|nr:Bicaudal D-related protein-like [Papilio xuthus]